MERDGLIVDAPVALLVPSSSFQCRTEPVASHQNEPAQTRCNAPGFNGTVSICGRQSTLDRLNFHPTDFIFSDHLQATRMKLRYTNN